MKLDENARSKIRRMAAGTSGWIGPFEALLASEIRALQEDLAAAMAKLDAMDLAFELRRNPTVVESLLIEARDLLWDISEAEDGRGKIEDIIGPVRKWLIANSDKIGSSEGAK